jgi:hypothetical protein
VSSRHVRNTCPSVLFCKPVVTNAMMQNSLENSRRSANQSSFMESEVSLPLAMRF